MENSSAAFRRSETSLFTLFPFITNTVSMTSETNISHSPRGSVQDKLPSDPKSPQTLDDEATDPAKRISLDAFVSDAIHHTKDGDAYRPKDGPWSPISRDGYRVHRLLDDLIEKVESATHVLATIDELDVPKQHRSVLIRDLQLLGNGLNCMSSIFHSFAGDLWDRELCETAWQSGEVLKPLFRLLPSNSRFSLLDSAGKKELLQRVTAWAGNEGDLRRLQSELAKYPEDITSRLEVVKAYVFQLS